MVGVRRSPRAQIASVSNRFRAPDTATIKRKMLCASSKDALKNALQGIRNHLQATCKSDLDLAAIISEKTKSK
jgi:hypothetical protein